MASRKIRVMIVDDSAVIRQVISDYINESPDMEVAATATDGQHASQIFRDVNPDVVTLDIEMPRMNGLETLQALLPIRPVPVIMVSALRSSSRWPDCFETRARNRLLPRVAAAHGSALPRSAPAHPEERQGRLR